MIFWTLTLLMLAIAVLCVLLPLARRTEATDDDVQPLDVYVEQLTALDSKSADDAAAKEALAQEKAEISRRILKQARSSGSGVDTGSFASGRAGRIGASLCALIGLPAIALATYLHTGSPELPDQPLSARLDQNLEDSSVEEMVLIAERHLAKNPDDARGWQVLAGVYGRMNRPMDRARALQELIRLSQASPKLLTDLGEALTVAGGNIVPVRARQMFEEALRMQPSMDKAAFYLAVAEEQEGKFEQALERWIKLSNLRPDDANWQAMIAQRQANMRDKLGIEQTTQPTQPAQPGPTTEQVEAAAAMSEQDRADMIAGMVEGLAARLEDEPQDQPGWSRLIRAYAVLGKATEAREALKKARLVFADQPEKLAALNSQLPPQLGEQQ
ncbi:MAG: c-type cytochrome biogenesis protein CcmI [Rhizobiaceae bacterium]